MWQKRENIRTIRQRVCLRTTEVTKQFDILAELFKQVHIEMGSRIVISVTFARHENENTLDNSIVNYTATSNWG